MNSSRLLYFFDLLNKETSGYTVEIANLIEKALDEDDDLNLLRDYRDNYSFEHEMGKSLYDEAASYYKQIYDNPALAISLKQQVRHVNERIGKDIARCKQVMANPWPTDEDLTVISNRDRASYLEALERIAATCIYLIAIYEGMDSLKGLKDHWSYNVNAGVQERQFNVNHYFLPALCNMKRPEYAWIIRKSSMGGKAFFTGDYFTLSYEPISDVEQKCNIYTKREPIGSMAYLNYEAYEDGMNEIPYCWGYGNIVSFTPANAIKMLSTNAVTKLRAPEISEYGEAKFPTPIGCVKKLAGGTGNEFCITPDDLVNAMNQWISGHEYIRRKSEKRCVVCGRLLIKENLICTNHFSWE